MPTKRALDAYYARYYANDPAERVTVANSRRFGQRLARAVTPSKCVRVLDFGGGDGTVSLHLARALLRERTSLVEITVVDYNDHLMDAADERIRLARCATLNEAIGTFDLVIASAIVEHVPDAHALLAELLARVAPGAVFYARTPYMLPMMQLARALGQTIDFTFPGHVHDLGQRFWERYMERAGFRIVRSQPSGVETAFRHNFARTLAAHVMKAPWRVLGRRYRLVGGWELVAQRPAGRLSETREASAGPRMPRATIQSWLDLRAGSCTSSQPEFGLTQANPALR